MADKKPKDLSVVFEKNKDARTFPVTGAWGGMSPDRTSITVNLYNEYVSIPNSIKADVKEDGSVDINSGERISRGDLTREIQGTMVLSPEQALSIGQWLVGKAQEALKSRGGK